MLVGALLAAMLPARTSSGAESFTAPASASADSVRAAARHAIHGVVARFVQEAGADVVGAVAILPLSADMPGAPFTAAFQDELATLGRNAGVSVVTRDDAALAAALSEVERGADFADAMDAASAQKLGRLQGAGVVVLCGVEAEPFGVGGARVTARLQAVEVETGRQLWGGRATGSDQRVLPLLRASGVPVVLALAGCLALAAFARCWRRAGLPR